MLWGSTSAAGNMVSVEGGRIRDKGEECGRKDERDERKLGGKE
jgi:hypothetical protein